MAAACAFTHVDRATLYMLVPGLVQSLGSLPKPWHSLADPEDLLASLEKLSPMHSAIDALGGCRTAACEENLQRCELGELANGAGDGPIHSKARQSAAHKDTKPGEPPRHDACTLPTLLEGMIQGTGPCAQGEHWLVAICRRHVLTWRQRRRTRSPLPRRTAPQARVRACRGPPASPLPQEPAEPP